MRYLGTTLLTLSVGTIFLDFIGYQFVVLSWLWHWGMETGFGILGTMFVAGAVLYFIGEDDEEAPCG